MECASETACLVFTCCGGGYVCLKNQLLLNRPFPRAGCGGCLVPGSNGSENVQEDFYYEVTFHQPGMSWAIFIAAESMIPPIKAAGGNLHMLKENKHIQQYVHIKIYIRNLDLIQVLFIKLKALTLRWRGMCNGFSYVLFWRSCSLYGSSSMKGEPA